MGKYLSSEIRPPLIFNHRCKMKLKAHYNLGTSVNLNMVVFISILCIL